MKARCGLENCDCEYTIGKLVVALEVALDALVYSALQAGNIDYWNEGGEGYAAYVRVQDAIDKEKRDR